MAANTAPIFTDVPVIGAGAWTNSLTANTTSTGASTIGTSSLLLFTAGTDGSYINRIRLTAAGSTAATATTATVARFYISTVASGATTNANTYMFAEVALPSQTTDQTTTATNYVEVPCGFYIPSGYYILGSMHHAAAANTQWTILVFGGNY
jgi:hypothetical protein